MMMIMMIMLLLLLLLLFPTITYSSTISNPTKWIVHAKGLAPSLSLKDRHQNHNHNNQQQLWLYFGSLFDPLDGRKIANVQGLELIQIINTNNNNNNNNHTNAKLQIIPLLYTNPNATYTDAVTILSQKVFCYTTTTENSITSEKNKNKNNQNDKKQQQQQQKQILLREIRVRPQSPKKRIPLEQAVSVFETCTTYVSKKKMKQQQQQHHNDMMMLMMDNDNNNNQNDDDEEEDELIIHTEFPKSKQTLWGKATNIKQSSSDNNSLEYTIFTKRRSPTSMLYQPDFTATAATTTPSSSTEISSTQPKRSQLIQIGPSNNNIETKHKFGARETYSWTNINIPPSSSQQQRRRRWWWKRDTINDHHPSTTTTSSTTNTNTNTNNNARISYTRYGEGPAFYAPGRMCMLELRGKPIQSIDNSTSILQNLIHNHIDGFGCGYLGGGDNNNNNNNVVAVFGTDDDRTSHRSLSNSNTFLRLKPEPISNQPIWQQRKIQLQKLYFKLQKAINVEHNHHDSYSSSGSNGISQYGVIPR